MLNIYLARHGQNIDNFNGILNGHRDLGLTTLGIDQANRLACAISQHDLEFDTIYTSPLIRARQTADIVAKLFTTEKQPVVLQNLIERDFGVMTGIEQALIEELCTPNIIKTEKITYFLNPIGAETFPDLLIRAEKLINQIKSTHKNGNILLVTHGDFGKMVYAQYYNLNWREVLTMFEFGNCELLLLSEQSNCSETHVFKTKQYNS